MVDQNLKNMASNLIRDFGTYVDVFLSASTTKGADYNPKYSVGETITNQNPISIKAYIRDKSSNSLIINKLGLVAVGSKEIIVKKDDASYFLNAVKVQIDDEDYETYNKATGNKVQIYDLDFGYKAIILFKSGS